MHLWRSRLVDTGAAITVVSEQFYRDILSIIHALKSKTVYNIKTADGHTTPVVGLVISYRHRGQSL